MSLKSIMSLKSSLFNLSVLRPLILTVAAVAVLAAGAQAQATPSLTAAQVVQIAQTFCQAIGQPVTAPGAATYRGTTPSSSAPPFWQPRWSVTFPDQADLDVVDATGVVCEYFNYALVDQESRSQVPAGSAISQASAIQIATSVLQASGQSAEIAFAEADELNLTGKASDHEWDVYWQRVALGYPYQSQLVNVTLLAETGQIQGFGIGFITPPLAGAVVDVTQAQAQATAEAVLNSAGLTYAMEEMHLAIVRPNTFWQNGDETEASTVSLAWVYRFTEPALVRRGQVCVDVQSGQVIAGNEYGFRGGAGAPRAFTPGRKADAGHRGRRTAGPPAAPPSDVARALRGATAAVFVSPSAPKGAPPLATLGAGSHPELLPLLQQAHPLPNGTGPRPGGARAYQVRVTAGSGPAQELSYVGSDIGVIGRGREWYAVPPAFRAWAAAALPAPRGPSAK